MARRNSPATLKNWSDNTESAPFRASVNANACWEVGLPPNDLITASRVSPGSRLLLAFTCASVRDYFVAGHRAANGAQVEADGAEFATRRRPVVAASPAKTLDESFARFSVAKSKLKATEDAIERAFNDEIERLTAAGEIQAALALTNAIPGDTVMKTIAVSRLMQSGKWDSDAQPLWKAERAPYTAESARVLTVWVEARNAYEAAQTAMERFLQPRLKGFVDARDRDGLAALIERTPGCVAKAFMIDARDYGIPRAIAKDAAAA